MNPEQDQIQTDTRRRLEASLSHAFDALKTLIGHYEDSTLSAIQPALDDMPDHVQIWMYGRLADVRRFTHEAQRAFDLFENGMTIRGKPLHPISPLAKVHHKIDANGKPACGAAGGFHATISNPVDCPHCERQ